MTDNKGIKKSLTKVELTIKNKTFIKHVENTMLETLKTTESEGCKITVSCDLSNKSYGNGAAVMASITLLVDQDDAQVTQAFALASSIVTEEARNALSEAENVFNG